MPMRVKNDVVSLETIRRRRLELDRYQLTAITRGTLAADSEWGTRIPGQRSPMPNFRWEIDSTRIDLWVLDHVTGTLFKIRPTLYVVFECFANAPIGIHLDIHPPCTSGFLAALRNAILPKTYVKACFKQVQTEWVLCGFPVEVFSDNGPENWAHHTRAALAALKLGIAYLPPYVPRYKPKVERFFRTLNQLLVHRLPGTTLGKRLPKRELDPRRDAKLSLIELAELLHITIVDEYMHMRMGHGAMTHERKWLTGLEVHDIELPLDQQAFDLAFCHRETRTLRSTGIHFKESIYQSDDLSYLRGRLGNSKDVTVLRPADRRGIYVLNPMTRNPLFVPAVTEEPEPLPYASLVPFGEEELEIGQTEEEEQVVKSAKERKNRIIDAATLRKSNAEAMSAAQTRSTFSKAPAFQDMHQERAASPSMPAPAASTPSGDDLAARLRRRLSDGDKQ